MHNRRKCIGLQALFCCRHLLPSSCRGDTDPANTKGLWSGPTASPGARQGPGEPSAQPRAPAACGGSGEARGHEAQVAVPRSPPCLCGHAPCSLPATAPWLSGVPTRCSRAGLGAPCCEAAPAASWPSPALPALPVPCLNAAPEPREALSTAELSLGWGSCCPAPRPSPGLCPTGMPPRRVPAAEPQQPPQPV